MIPRDYRVFEVGESFTVTCDVSEFYAPETLAFDLPLDRTHHGHLRETTSRIPTASRPTTASTFVPVPADCIENVTGAEAFLGSVESASVDVTFAGDPVASSEIVEGQCSASPPIWQAHWAENSGPSIAFTLSGVPAALVDTASIRLNGTAGIVPGSAKASGRNLTFKMARDAAVQSLGSVSPGSTELPRLTGAVRPGSGFEQFRAVCPVEAKGKDKDKGK